MAGIRVEGSTSGNVAEVDSNNQLKVIQGQASTPAAVGAARFFSEIDPGTIVGTAVLRSPRVSPNKRLRVGVDTVLFSDIFNATVQNTYLWNYIFVTMTALLTDGAGYVRTNTQGTAATHGFILKTFQHFPVMANGPLRADFTFGLFTATLVANEEWRMGLASPTVAGTAPVDGIYFVLTTAGMKGAIIFNGVETQTAAFKTLASYTLGSYFKGEILVSERGVEFWQDSILMAVLALPVGNGQPFQSASLPLFLQKICTGAVSNTNQIRVTDVSVHITELATNKSWESQLSTAGQHGSTGQNGHTMGSTANYANSANPAAAVPTNTTAALGTGLGGQFWETNTLAANSDGIIQSYQNPAPTINITGRNLLIYSVTYHCYNQVAMATVAFNKQVSLAYGHNTVTLATAESVSFTTATAHAPRRVPLGVIQPVAAVNTVYPQYIARFQAPLVVRPGEFIALVSKNVGTVPATGVCAWMITYDAVWE